ncbi:CHAD domain containing protein [Chloroherpeton thalassium ATCC 35110]|uniref:CHAD domain containing protein n=1 Tax=Chloroherpeton thalassium (strain ATCC 35110 / GB-78) TaxID=517418 RepID=B3QUL9_CHLT3|nr:CHAD domain-containing protein [Chloroherpeton thalassium]ACF12925.1 CHAD domain containing protein [Chloroherpeton thalassium ATCC 35110]
MSESKKKNVETLGSRARKAVRKHYKKILRHEQPVREDKDPEELHQMRVAMRRLRSVASGFSPILSLPKAASQKQIGKFSRTLGALRDLDILLESLEKRYAPELLKREKPHFQKMVFELYARRSMILATVRDMLASESYAAFKSAMDDWLKVPEMNRTSQMPIQSALPDLLFPMVNQLFLHEGWMPGVRLHRGELIPPDNFSLRKLNFLLKTEGSLLHDLRKQIKRVRYQLAFFTDLYGETYTAYVNDTKHMQDMLGLIQDSLVLEATLQEFHGELYKKRIPTVVKMLMAERLAAWQEWEKIRTIYLLEETRDNFRRELLNLK